jgi:pimeloyl-ACP methyl ester carboxylesterase
LYDARGQGQSDLGEGSLSIERHLEDLSALLRHLEIERMHLVGISHGAHVASVYAADLPESIDSLILCSVSARPSFRAKLIVKSWLHILRHSNLETMAWASLPILFGETYLKEKEKILPMIVKGIVKRNNKESVLAQLEASSAYTPLVDLSDRLKVPTLVISASDDPLVTEEGARELSRLVGAKHEHVQGVGHSTPTERPQWFTERVLEFIHTLSLS